MLITKLNPQNPDFAESEGSGGGAKKQTEFVLSKQPTFRAKQAFTNLFNRIKSKGNFAPFFCDLESPQKLLLRKVEEKAVRQNIIYYVLAKACFRDGLLLRFRKKSRKLNFLRCARYRSQIIGQCLLISC